jgi:transcriptional regulator with XRE-family HTH domain
VLKMDIIDRLKKLKNELGMESKKDMATLLKISESFYSMIESGKKPVSKNVLKRLVVLSRLPEEYWLYGITDEKEYLQKREEFKCLKDLIEQLGNIGLLDIDNEFSDGVKEVILAAAIADISHIIEKKKQKL